MERVGLCRPPGAVWVSLEGTVLSVKYSPGYKDHIPAHGDSQGKCHVFHGSGSVAAHGHPWPHTAPTRPPQPTADSLSPDSKRVTNKGRSWGTEHWLRDSLKIILFQINKMQQSTLKTNSL